MLKGIIWLINPYGNIPGEGWSDYRFNMLACALVDAGFKVRWWAAGFEHRSKVFRTNNLKHIEINKNYSISLVPVSGYKKHISFQRIRFERQFANGVLKYHTDLQEKPDLLFYADPAVFVEDLYRQLAAKLDKKYIVDIIDIWPEIFVKVLPNALKPFQRILFSPLYYRRQKFIFNSSAIIAVSKDYLEIGKKINPNIPSKVVYWGVNDLAENVKIVSDNIKKQCDKKAPSDLWLIYAGTLGENYDIKSIIKLSEKFKQNPKIKFFIAGDGPLRDFVVNSIVTLNLENVKYLGRLNHLDLVFFYNFCDIAISSYIKDSTVSMPIKAFDFFKFGLPVLNSLGRDFGGIVTESECGMNYEPENIEDMYLKLNIMISNRERLNQMKINSILVSKEFDSKAQYKAASEWVENIFFNV